MSRDGVGLGEVHRFESWRQRWRWACTGRWGTPSRQAIGGITEVVRILGLMPGIPEEAQRPRAGPVLGVGDLWHHGGTNWWRCRRSHRCVGRLGHGLARRRRSVRSPWYRRVWRHWIGTGVAGHGQGTAGDHHAREHDLRGVCGGDALSISHVSRLSSLVVAAFTLHWSGSRRTAIVPHIDFARPDIDVG